MKKKTSLCGGSGSAGYFFLTLAPSINVRLVLQVDTIDGNTCQILFALDDYIANGTGLTNGLEES
jgi:hypothetical protein